MEYTVLQIPIEVVISLIVAIVSAVSYIHLVFARIRDLDKLETRLDKKIDTLETHLKDFISTLK